MRLIRLLKKDLAREISSWVDKDLLSVEQARSICLLYDVDYASMQNRSVGYGLLVSLGYLFVGLSVITLLGANWDEIPRAVRLAGLLVLTAGTHGLALRFYLTQRELAATGLFLLGNLFYGASIILIAQIYHLGEHMPDGVFWWALGSLPFGILLKNSWLTLFSCLLALLWFVLEYSMGFFPAVFPLFIVAAVYVLFQGRSSTLLFLTTVASIGVWIETALAVLWASGRHRFDFFAEHVLVSVALFIFAYAFSHWLNARNSVKAKDYGVLLSLWTLRFGLIAMLILSYEEPWRELIRWHWSHQVSMWIIVASLLGMSIGLGWKTKKLKSLLPMVVFCSLSMVAVVLSRDSANAIYFQVVYNIALIGTGIWLILRGIHDGISHYFFLGIATILLTAFMRYVDLIGEYVGGAILFLVLAAFLLGAAKYWRVLENKEARS